MEEIQDIIEERPNYYAIIPASVRYDNRLSANEKLMYGEITCLCNKHGECWATNNYFGKLYNVTYQTVSGWINNLKKYGYITTDMVYKKDSKEIDKRIIKIKETICIKQEGYSGKTGEGVRENPKGGIRENPKENNTSINNTSINNIPSLQDVKDYVKEKNLNVNAEQFHLYYSENGWKDNRGKPVRNWKLKCVMWNKNSTDKEVKKDKPKFVDQYANMK